MPKLSSNQLQEYNDNGYVTPIKVLTKDQAFETRKEIENIETKWSDELKGAGRNYVYMISPILDEVLGKMFVQQARGDDIFKYHQHSKRPSSLMKLEDINARKQTNDDLQEIFYPDSTRKRDL